MATLVVGCSETAAPDSRPKVVVTTNILADVVGQVAGEGVEVVTLVPPGSDPHEFAISSADLTAIGSADLLVANGLGLEQGVLDILRSAASDGIPLLELAPGIDPIRFAGGQSDGGEQTGVGDFDPHFWHDPRRMAVAVGLLQSALEDAIPGLSGLSERAASYITELGALDSRLAAEFLAIPAERRVIVTNHDSLGYLADRYGIEVLGVVIPGGDTLASPNSADLAALVQVLREGRVTTLFAENISDRRALDAVAAELGQEVEVVTLLTDSLDVGVSYLNMLESNASAILESMR